MPGFTGALNWYRKAAEQGFERDLSFDARERGAETEMRGPSEGDVPVRVPVDDYLVGKIELGLVAVRRTVRENDT